jgi:hypothetical protein
MLSMQELLEVPEPDRNLKWLQDSLQSAVQVELTTIPPYLAACWSIRDIKATQSALAARLISEIFQDEMLHMGLACNMLSALGRDPEIASAVVVPIYPGPLPGGIHPGLCVTPTRLSDASLQKFMVIEYPENGPIALFWSAGQTYATIGEFYTDVRTAFDNPKVKLPDPFDTKKQLVSDQAGLTIIQNKKEAQAAIDLITHQGEGTCQSPYKDGSSVSEDNLAHYYKFAKLFHKHQIRKNPDPHAPLPYDFKGPAKIGRTSQRPLGPITSSRTRANQPRHFTTKTAINATANMQRMTMSGSNFTRFFANPRWLDPNKPFSLKCHDFHRRCNNAKLHSVSAPRHHADGRNGLFVQVWMGQQRNSMSGKCQFRPQQWRPCHVERGRPAESSRAAPSCCKFA